MENFIHCCIVHIHGHERQIGIQLFDQRCDFLFVEAGIPRIEIFCPAVNFAVIGMRGPFFFQIGLTRFRDQIAFDLAYLIVGKAEGKFIPAGSAVNGFDPIPGVTAEPGTQCIV